jgi:predicted 2-oxoglutarate/Fe(II)-dependent dioxygenase YbiX
MPLVIPKVLAPEQLTRCRDALATAPWAEA